MRNSYLAQRQREDYLGRGAVLGQKSLGVSGNQAEGRRSHYDLVVVGAGIAGLNGHRNKSQAGSNEDTLMKSKIACHTKRYIAASMSKPVGF